MSYMVICKQHPPKQKERQSVSQSNVASFRVRRKLGQLGSERASGGQRLNNPYLDVSSFQLFGQAPQELEVLLLRPRGDSERRRERGLDEIVREEFVESVQVEDFDEVKVVQDRLQLGRGAFGDFERGRHGVCAGESDSEFASYFL